MKRRKTQTPKKQGPPKSSSTNPPNVQVTFTQDEDRMADRQSPIDVNLSERVAENTPSQLETPQSTSFASSTDTNMSTPCHRLSSSILLKTSIPSYNREMFDCAKKFMTGLLLTENPWPDNEETTGLVQRAWKKAYDYRVKELSKRFPGFANSGGSMEESAHPDDVSFRLVSLKFPPPDTKSLFSS